MPPDATRNTRTLGHARFWHLEMVREQLESHGIPLAQLDTTASLQAQLDEANVKLYNHHLASQNADAKDDDDDAERVAHENAEDDELKEALDAELHESSESEEPVGDETVQADGMMSPLTPRMAQAFFGHDAHQMTKIRRVLMKVSPSFSDGFTAIIISMDKSTANSVVSLLANAATPVIAVGRARKALLLPDGNVRVGLKDELQRNTNGDRMATLEFLNLLVALVKKYRSIVLAEFKDPDLAVGAFTDLRPYMWGFEDPDADELPRSLPDNEPAREAILATLAAARDARLAACDRPAKFIPALVVSKCDHGDHGGFANLFPNSWASEQDSPMA